MVGLRDQFAPYYAPGEDAVAAALKTGLVTPDTNVLLAAYRFERQARDELFSAFGKLGDRLWIPHQVALEFHRNRFGAIAQQEAFFGKARDDLDAAMTSYLSKLKAFIGRIAMPQPRAQELEQAIRDAHAQVTAQVTSAEEANEVHLDSRDSDEVLVRLEALFDGRVGDPMGPAELEAARKEAKRRADQKIPPAYMDKGKADSSGDYLVWKQLLEESATRQLPVVLVTDDTKEDWVRREHGLTLGPRPELCEEMSAAAGVPFLLMSTSTFLWHAKKHLSVSVSPETVDQARELPATLYALDRALLEEEMRDEEIEKLRARLLRVRVHIDDATDVARDEEGRFLAFEEAISADGPVDKKTRDEARDRVMRAEAARSALLQQHESITAALEALEAEREALRASRERTQQRARARRANAV